MSESDDAKKYLGIGVSFGAMFGILGNLWVGALLNYISYSNNDPTIAFLLILIIGLIVWLWAVWQISKLLPQTS